MFVSHIFWFHFSLCAHVFLFHFNNFLCFLTKAPGSLFAALNAPPPLFLPLHLFFFLWRQRWSQVGLQTWLMWLRLTHATRHELSAWSQQWHKHKHHNTADRLGGATSMRHSHASVHYHHLVLCDHYWRCESSLLTVSTSMAHTRTCTHFHTRKATACLYTSDLNF